MEFHANSQVLIQGITTPMGQFHARRMQQYGTHVVAGVMPGEGGTPLDPKPTSDLAPIPLFDLVEQAIDQVGPIDVSILFNPAPTILDAGLEAIAAGIRYLIVISEGVPPLDMIRLIQAAEQSDTIIIGSNSAGLIIPDEVLLGIYPPFLYQPGSVGVISRSSTLSFEVAAALTHAGMGQSVCVGIGGDLMMGSSLPQWLQWLEEHESTQSIVLVGEIGGSAEEEAAHHIAEGLDKPVVAYIAGITAPEGMRMGHAGAVINPAESQTLQALLSSTSFKIAEASQWPTGSAQRKIAALQAVGVKIADRPSQIPELLRSF